MWDFPGVSQYGTPRSKIAPHQPILTRRATTNWKLQIYKLRITHMPPCVGTIWGCFMVCDGEIYKGSYTELAAYYPSLGIVQVALVVPWRRKVVVALVGMKEGVVNPRKGKT